MTKINYLFSIDVLNIDMKICLPLNMQMTSLMVTLHTSYSLRTLRYLG